MPIFVGLNGIPPAQCLTCFFPNTVFHSFVVESFSSTAFKATRIVPIVQWSVARHSGEQPILTFCEETRNIPENRRSRKGRISHMYYEKGMILASFPLPVCLLQHFLSPCTHLLSEM